MLTLLIAAQRGVRTFWIIFPMSSCSLSSLFRLSPAIIRIYKTCTVLANGTKPISTCGIFGKAFSCGRFGDMALRTYEILGGVFTDKLLFTAIYIPFALLAVIIYGVITSDINTKKITGCKASITAVCAQFHGFIIHTG